VEGPFDYYASVSGRNSAGYRDHSSESTEMLFSDLGYKFNDHLENRFYIIADQTDRELPGALSLQQMNQDPQQAQVIPASGGVPGTSAIQENFRKDWYYLRLADKLSYVNGGEEADAGGYWWHREAYEPNLYLPGNYYQGIGSFYADDFGALFNSTTHSHFWGQDNVFTIGFNPTTEREVDAYFENLNGKQGSLTGADKEWSFNTVLYAQNQHYLTEKLSLVTGVQAGYAERHFYDDDNNTASGNQSADLIYRSVNPKVGLIYELNDKSQLFANFSRSWQPPSFDDMVDFDSGYNTSQTLTPLASQKAWTAEVGTRGEQGRFEWDFALYHSWVHDELLDGFNPQFDTEVGGVNITHSYQQGIEGGLNVRLLNAVFQRDATNHFADTLTLRQDFTLSDLHFANDPVYGNNRIAGVPEYDYQMQLMYEHPIGFYAGPNLHWIATSFPVDNSNTLNAPAYALLGFKTGMQITKNFSIFFEAKNLLDERYASSVDPISDNAANGGTAAQTAQVFHPGAPRAFYFGITWKL
jgi:iron complex outermembrane receptor protein